MESEVLVYVDLYGVTHLVGRLWVHVRGSRQSATFEYDQSWLDNDERFALEPAIQLSPGPHHTGGQTSLFGAISDSAPDRWGRALMRRAERRSAELQNRTPRTLMEIDYLLMVDDEVRPGALRFSTAEAGPFLASHSSTAVPLLVDLSRLLLAADRVIDASENDEDLRLLLAPGSSLGGARPKASVRDRDGMLAMAKFPHANDDIDIVRWEAVALTIAEKAGIQVPNWRLESVSDKPVLLVHRFDRSNSMRIPFLSALSMLGARDNEERSYLEFVDALRQHGAAPEEDMRALWRRIVFYILISNTDDHLRNHGFLYYGPDGWRLAPAYDLNPVPVDIKPRILSTTIDLDDGTASIDLALEVAEYFELSSEEALDIVKEVQGAVAQWRTIAARYGLGGDEIERMASAFEHA